MSNRGSRDSTWLAGGLAPSVWQQEIAWNTAWVNALRATCSWTQAFISPPALLNDAPLLGPLLALLTTPSAQSTQLSPAAVRSTRVKPDRVQASANHEPFLSGDTMIRPHPSKVDHGVQQHTAAPTRRITGDIPGNSRKRRWTPQTASVAHTKPDWLTTNVDSQVTHARLRQWAGDVADIPGIADTAGTMKPVPAVGSFSTRNTPASISRPYYGRTPLSGYPIQRAYIPRGYSENGNKDSNGVSGGVSEPALSSQSWQRSLIEQTRRMLQQTSQPLSINPVYQPPVGHVEREELLLAEQWATTIGEHTAPLAVLQHYATLSRGDNVAVQRNGQHNANVFASLPENSVPATANTAKNMHTMDSNRNRAEHVRLNKKDVLALVSGDGANDSYNPRTPLTQEVAQQAIERTQGTADVEEQILPPQVAAQLPPLITSQRIDKIDGIEGVNGVYVPPLPVAAATARIGARAEMMIEEDLDVLAAKIKRILDDEARRHGIDV